MTKQEIIRKLKIAKDNPDLGIKLSNEELADLVLVVLGAVDQIEASIKEGRLDGKTPEADKDYLSKETATKYLDQAIKDMLAKSDSTLTAKQSEFEQRIQKALEVAKPGKDGVVTDAEIKRAAEIAFSMIELPDFDQKLVEIVQMSGVDIRNALESIPKGEEQLSQGAVRNLPEDLDELRKQINNKEQEGFNIGTAKHVIRNTVRTMTISDLSDVTKSATAPSNPSVGDLWVDIS